MVTVKYQDLSAAFDFVSFAAPMEHHAYLSIDTGTIYWISELNPLEEEIPEDLETSDRYLAIPHKNDLDLGNDLALRFASAEVPHRYNTIEQFFRHRGAYARFKELLASEGCLDKWYAFEAESTEQAFRYWCADNDINVIGNNQQSAYHALEPTRLPPMVTCRRGARLSANVRRTTWRRKFDPRARGDVPCADRTPIAPHPPAPPSLRPPPFARHA